MWTITDTSTESDGDTQKLVGVVASTTGSDLGLLSPVEDLLDSVGATSPVHTMHATVSVKRLYFRGCQILFI